MPDYNRLARLAEALGMSIAEVEEMLASEASDLACRARAEGDAASALAYGAICTAQWAEAAATRAHASR